MKVEILHIDDCPNTAEAGDRLRSVLDSEGYTGADIAFVLIRSADDAAGVLFAGSPTILVDGKDLFPSARTQELACRIYSTPTGLAGIPTVDQLKEALTSRNLHGVVSNG